MVEIIHERSDNTSPFDAIKQYRPDGMEYWSGRELMELLGYDKWERFSGAVDRATITAQNQGVNVTESFSRRRENPPGGTKPREDVYLTRYAAYLVAMNGDPRKAEVASAQSYFAISTREAESHREETFEEKTLTVLHGLTQKVEEQRRALAVAGPKAEAYDEFLADGGDYDRRAAASILTRRHGITLGQNKLTDLLIDWGWIGEDRRPKYPYTSREYFASRPYKDPILNERTGEYFTPAPQLRITAKGIDAIAKKLKRNDSKKELAA